MCCCMTSEWTLVNGAARDQITHRVVKGSLGACCWSSLSVLYLLFLQSVLYSSTNEACVCRVLIFVLILHGISGAQLLWSVLEAPKKYCLIYTSLIMNVAYLGWCPTQTAYTAYSIVHIWRGEAVDLKIWSDSGWRNGLVSGVLEPHQALQENI